MLLPPPLNGHPPRQRQRAVLVGASGAERTALALLDVEVEEAVSLAAASALIRVRPPAVVVLGERLAEGDAVEFCRELAVEPRTSEAAVVVVGAVGALRRRALQEAGAVAVLRGAERQLDLIEVVEGLLVGRLLRWATRQPIDALADAIARKDTGTRAHSQRVDEYAKHLVAAIDPRLLADRGLESGFLLHDVGKIAIPDRILLKAGPLTVAEQRVMRTHTTLGEQMVAQLPLVGPAGRAVVRSHHERWDGRGYPDRLAGDEIPLGARVFAVVDALDAMTTQRPYRPATSWTQAVAEIEREAGRQFDPAVVEAFVDLEQELRGIYRELAAA